MKQRASGQSCYAPGPDRLLMWAGTVGIAIEAGAGADGTGAFANDRVYRIGDPPLLIRGRGGGEIHGHITPHPDDPNRMLCLEERGGSQVWDSTDYGATWSPPKSYTHPFQSMVNVSTGEWTCGTVGPHGVVIGMTSNRSGGETVVWKPNS